MKNFLQHLTESRKTYEFIIKIADIDPADIMDQLKASLDAYGLDSLSKPKRLPIKANDIDFPSLPNVQLYLLDAVLTYPVNDAQLRAIVAERSAIPLSNIVVVPKNHPEQIWRWNTNGDSELRTFKKGEAVLDKPYEADSQGSAEASKAYSQCSFLKELSSPKYEIAGSDVSDGKTTNDIVTGDTSPVGSTQNKITKVK
jgi:hypothetical protein